MAKPKPFLENQNSLSGLISPTPTTSCGPDFSNFHLPPVTTKIYPYVSFASNPNKKGSGSSGSDRKNKFKGDARSNAGIGRPILWFTLGILLSALIVFSGWNLKLIRLSGTTSSSNPGDLIEVREKSRIGISENKCVSPVCMQAAARILHRLNATSDPCVDFYEFSCGNFIAHNEIPDDGFQRSTLQEMQESILVEIKSL